MTRILLATAAAIALAACTGSSDEAVDGDDVRVAVPDTDGQTVAGYGGNDVAERGTAPASNRLTMNDSTMMMQTAFDVMNSAGRSIGTATITDTESGVDVALDLTSIPAGSHAIHFHETGSCDTPDFTSAGGHYNPGGVNHGFEAATPRPHAGDMRNFEAPQSGVVKTTVRNERVSLSSRDGFAPLYDGNGTALIIHAKADDYESQPSGAAGARIACAVISR